jgi:hypothetical protein
MTATIGAGKQKKTTTTTTTSTMTGQTSPSSSLPAGHLEQPQHQQQQQQHYYTLYTQRACARHRIRHPPPARPFTDFDLAVNFRAKQSKTGKELVLYASRGRFDDNFPVNVFEFAGWTLKPEVVVKDEDLLFQNLSQGTKLHKPGSSSSSPAFPFSRPATSFFVFPPSILPSPNSHDILWPSRPL